MKAEDNHNTFGCKGNLLKTVDGGYIDLVEPTPEQVRFKAISIGLSHVCRFGGQCPKFYSVAEHSVLATRLAQEDAVSQAGQLAVLFHDASEAFLGDVVKPFKNFLLDYPRFEEAFMKVIRTRFGISNQFYNTVKWYDRLMLKAEKQALWPGDKEPWEGFELLEDRFVPFGFLRPTMARYLFEIEARKLGVTGT